MANKFSVVIPTLHYCPGTFNKLLQILVESPMVKEVFIIDNDQKIGKTVDYVKSNKFHWQYPESNLYVNPSWNLGVALSREDHLVLLSDDVIVSDDYFYHLEDYAFKEWGVVGIAQHSIINAPHSQLSRLLSTCYIQPSDTRNWGFGTVMVMHKNHFTPIPHELRVWFGDDFLYAINKNAGRQNGVFVTKIMTQMSTTSDLPEYNSVKHNDGEYYKTLNL